MIRCTSCAASNPAGARFCNQCGLRLGEQLADQPASAQAPDGREAYTPRHLVERVLRDRAAMVGERKRVTVLFADIKGSTRLAEQAGAEAWHHILDRFFGLLAGAVHRYEGTINQYTGDGVMALFGAPVAHEDHAARAALAALDMQAAVRAYADELRLDRGLNLTLRIGLNTGEVIVGRIGDDLRMDYTAQGATVNLAARLEQICEPGSIYLSRSTAALFGGMFRLRELGGTRVAGLAQPVMVYALEGRSAHESRLHSRLAAGASPFLGREPELAQLHAALARAAAGSGCVVGVSGPAGIGKSRLLHELLAAAEQRGIAVHRTAASPYARHRPMSAPRALFLSRIGCLGETDGDRVRLRVEAEMEAAVPESIRRRPGALAYAQNFAGVSPQVQVSEALSLSLREPMVQALARYLPASPQPQVLLFEDLQELDAVTMDFVRQLTIAVAGTATLLLLSWRDEALPAGLPTLDERLVLAPLADANLIGLARHWLGQHPSVAQLAERIAGRAAGNPYFVEEAVLSLAESGELTGERGAFGLRRELVELPIPDTVHALIAARIDRLDTECKTLLQAASVMGSGISATRLLPMLEPPATPEQIAAWLSRLVEAGFLQAAGADLGFAQPLLREVAYDGQLESQRAILHSRLAQALVRACGDRPVQSLARSVAGHWALAGEWLEAGRWNLHAAQWFVARDARITAEQFQHAVEHLDRAPLDPAHHRLRIAARAGLIRLAQFVKIDPATVDAAYAEARQLADACGDPHCAAELSISYGNELMHRGRPERSVALITEAFEQCPEPLRASLATRFRLAILMSHASIGRLREGIELANRAGGADWLVGPIGPDNSLSRGFMAMHLAWSGDLPRAREDLDEAIRLTEDDQRSASWMHGLRVELAWFSGDTDGILDQVERALAQAVTFGSRYFRALALRSQAQALILLGRHAEALAPLAEALPMTAAGAEAYQFQANLRAVLAEALLGLGRLDEAAQESAAAVAAAQEIGARLWELRAWIARLALPSTVLDTTSATAGFARARELLDTMQAQGVAPRLDELEAAHAATPAARLSLLHRAAAGYVKLGAQAHADRLLRSENAAR